MLWLKRLHNSGGQVLRVNQINMVYNAVSYLLECSHKFWSVPYHMTVFFFLRVHFSFLWEMGLLYTLKGKSEPKTYAPCRNMSNCKCIPVTASLIGNFPQHSFLMGQSKDKGQCPNNETLLNTLYIDLHLADIETAREEHWILMPFLS